MFRSITILIFVVFSFGLYSQTNTACEKIYEKPDTLAQFGDSKKSLRQYFNDKIMPILSDCIKQKMEFVNSMEIKFTIDKSGKVSAVDFLKPVLSDYCGGKLRAEILAMKGWQPGKNKGEKVCSVFIYSIGGIRWE